MVSGYVNPWVGLVAGLFYELVGAFTFAFPIYSTYLKEHVGMSQTELMIVNLGQRAGGLLGIVGGAVYDRDDHPFGGARMTALGAAMLHISGTCLLYLAITDQLPTPTRHWHIVIATTLFGAGAAWADLTAVCTPILNMPRSKGPLVGLLKAFMGLSSSVIAQVHLGLFAGDTPGFLRFIVVAFGATHFLLAPLFDKLDPETRKAFEKSETHTRRSRIKIAYAIVITLALFLFASSLATIIPLDGRTHMDSKTVRIALTAVMGVLLGSLWLVPLVPQGARLWLAKAEVEGRRAPLIAAAVEGKVAFLASEGSDEGKGEIGDGMVDGVTLGAALCDQNLWLLLVICSSLDGVHAISYTNMPQLVRALGEPSGHESVYVTIVSVTSTAARLLVPNILGKRFKRPHALLMACTMMLTATSMLLFKLPFGLYVVAGLIGFAHGTYWGNISTLVFEVFGKTAFGSIYTCFRVCPLVLPVALNIIFGLVYDKNAHESSPPICTKGPSCYADAMHVAWAVILTTTVMCLLLVRRLRHIYEPDERPPTK